jgi:hypothetical protein
VRPVSGLLVLALTLSTSFPSTALRAGPPAGEGTLIAAFITRTQILLCSDGRVVNSATGTKIADDWSKVRRLSTRAGMLTAGRDLPGLMRRFQAKLGDDPSARVTDVVELVRASLDEEWKAAFAAADRRAADTRVFVFVAGFDGYGAPRLFEIDSRSGFRVDEVPLFRSGRDIEIDALSTASGVDEEPSVMIAKHLNDDFRYAEQLPWFLAAFDATKEALGLRNPKIGGRTFAATIGAQTGFRDFSAER